MPLIAREIELRMHHYSNHGPYYHHAAADSSVGKGRADPSKDSTDRNRELNAQGGWQAAMCRHRAATRSLESAAIIPLVLKDVVFLPSERSASLFVLLGARQP
jgi:hypothetical protein